MSAQRTPHGVRLAGRVPYHLRHQRGDQVRRVRQVIGYGAGGRRIGEQRERQRMTLAEVGEMGRRPWGTSARASRSTLSASDSARSP